VGDTLGKRLKKLRTQKRWTLGEVAEKLSLRGHSTYSNWEYDRTEPDTEMLGKLADLFGITVDQLLGSNTKNKSGTTYDSGNETETIIREIVEKYSLDLTIPGTREKLENIIKLVVDDHTKK
jgi:transcriptional regulator with XRE-family HTH domain